MKTRLAEWAIEKYEREIGTKTLAQLEQELNDEQEAGYHNREGIIMHAQSLYIFALEKQLETLEAELAALKPDAPDLVAMAQADEPINKGIQNGLTTDIKWPKSPLICKCGENKDHAMICPNCGGFLF